MLAASSHPWKVNFCKFTNETRNGIEDMTEAGQTWIAALNGTAAGGGYEMALACDRILLVDDRSSAVSLPEVPLLGVLPGTGGLTRVIDKRKVRKDRADVFATRSEGFGGARPSSGASSTRPSRAASRDRVAAERAAEAAARSDRPADAQGISLTPLQRTETDDAITYDHVRVAIDRGARTAAVVVAVPDDLTDDPAEMHDQGAAHPLLAITRELDDAILRLRTNELEVGTWLVLTEGSTAAALAADRLIADHQDDWLVAETTRYLKRVLKRLDVTSRSLIALVEPGSCFAGPFLELALACDRQYMLEGVFEEDDDATLPSGAAAQEPAVLVVTEAQFGTFPMGNGLTRLGSRFYGDDEGAGGGPREVRRGALRRRRRRPGPGHRCPRRHRLDRRDPDSARGAGLAEPRRPHRHGGQPPVRRPGDHGDQDLRAAHGLAELDLRPAQRERPRRRAAQVRHRPEGRLRPEASVR